MSYERVNNRVTGDVSIPFRADTGFEQSQGTDVICTGYLFQSLSGLTLGLNQAGDQLTITDVSVSIPFRADTGFEP